MDDSFEYLVSGIKSYMRPSPVHGIGLFALVDIKKGEQVFPKWKGETGWYNFSWKDSEKIPNEVIAYLLRSFGGNEKKDESSYVNFHLTKDCNFLFANPLALINTLYEEGSVDSNTGIALKDIKKDNEIFGNYQMFPVKLL